MSPEDRLGYAVMSLEQRPVAAGAAVEAIRAVLGDIARLRAEIAAARAALAIARAEIEAMAKAGARG